MTLAIAHRVGLTASCTLAMLAVLMGGAFPAWMWLGVAVPALSNLAGEAGWRLSARAGTGLAAAGVVWGLWVIMSDGIAALLYAGAGAMMVVLWARLLTRAGLRDELQALLLGLLLVFSGAGLHTEIAYGLIFVAFAVATVWALLTRELVAGAEREAQRKGGAHVSSTLARRDVVTPGFLGVVGLVAVGILSITAATFALFPRVGFGTLAFLAQRPAVVPDTVSLNGSLRGAGDARVMARVWGLPRREVERGLYLRAATYEMASPAGFTPAEGERVGSTRRLPLASDTERYDYQVYMQPLSSSAFLALGPLLAANVLAGGRGNPNLRTTLVAFGDAGLVTSASPLGGPVRYQVRGWLSGAGRASRPVDQPRPLSPEAMEALTAVPAEWDELRPLARAIAGDATRPDVIAARTEAYLAGNYTYSLEQPSSSRTPLVGFLLEHRTGHCEVFATALAALLRLHGIPTRVVGGFAFGQWEPQGEVVVFTARDAHAWTEWYHPELGWVGLDATPASDLPRGVLQGLAAMTERMRRAWDDYVLDYGIAEQVTALRSMGRQLDGARSWLSGPSRRWLWTTLGVVLFVGAIWALRRRLERPRGRHPLAVVLERWVAQTRGQPLAPSETLRGAVSRLSAEIAATPSLQRALVAYEREAYGGERVSPAQRRALARALRRARPR